MPARPPAEKPSSAAPVAATAATATCFATTDDGMASSQVALPKANVKTMSAQRKRSDHAAEPAQGRRGGHRHQHERAGREHPGDLARALLGGDLGPEGLVDLLQALGVG